MLDLSSPSDAGARTVGDVILVVDDNEAGRYATSRLLESEGYTVLQASTGSEALELLSEEPDLIVLDVNLPDMSGFDVARTIRRRLTQRVPVLQVSATSLDSRSHVVGLEAGADAYLTEPVERGILLATIQSLLRAARAEREAVRRAREWQTTFDAIASPLALLDPQGRVVRANHAMAELLDCPEEACVGRVVADAIDPEHAIEALHTTDATNQDRRHVPEVRVGDRWFQATIDPRRDDGRVIGFVIALTDVTEARTATVSAEVQFGAAQAAHHLLEVVVQQLPVGLIVAEAPSGRVLVANEEAQRVWGAPIPAGIPIGEREPRPRLRRDGDWLDRRALSIYAALEGREQGDESEIELERPDGSEVAVEMTSAPVRDDAGKIVAAVAVLEDISERVANEQLREAFVGMLSHELRTPITTIYGGTQVLARRGSSLPDETVRQIVEDIAGEANRLQRIAENLLVVTRIERGATLGSQEPILLQRLAQRVVETEGQHWPSMRIALSLAACPAVAGDEGQVELVIRNLVSNAGKYGGDEVEVAVAAAEGEVQLRVLDRGPGLPPEDEGDLFALFYRSSRTAGKATGTGIGLFVVRSLVERMGGRAWARNRDGGGAEFGFALPDYDD